jgi:hypothetical protein
MEVHGEGTQVIWSPVPGHSRRDAGFSKGWQEMGDMTENGDPKPTIALEIVNDR